MKSVSQQPGDLATFAMCKQERRKGKTSRDNAHVEKLPLPRSISFHGVSQNLFSHGKVQQFKPKTTRKTCNDEHL
jgi:hypothetical protein